jgi:trk system potassium uptake protein TrkA
MRVIIVGGGDVGTTLAEVLIKEKHDVILVESDEKRAEELGEKMDALVLHGDASDRKILKDANIQKSGALLTLTSDDKTNLLVCEVAKSFNVPIIISRVNDPSKDQIFSNMGITATINTLTTAVNAFKHLLEKPEKKNYLVAGNKAQIMERVINKDSKILNKKIGDINKKVIISAILRDGELVKAEAKTKMQEGDTIIICAPVEESKRVDKLFEK